MYALISVWRVLMSLPLAVVWVLMYLLLLAGWGTVKADQFMLHWYKFVAEEDADIVRKANEANGQV